MEPDGNSKRPFPWLCAVGLVLMLGGGIWCAFVDDSPGCWMLTGGSVLVGLSLAMGQVELF